MKDKIKKLALSFGFASAGITSAEKIPAEKYLYESTQSGRNAEMKWLARDIEKRCDPRSIFPEAKSVICLALAYDERGIDGPENFDVKKARYARGKDYHDVAKEKMAALWNEILNLLPDAKAKFCVDTSAILEKALAERAGLGWIGKHSILLNEELGSSFVLCEIFTDIELSPDAPAENRCGECDRCINACPTCALISPFCVDSRLCISYWTTFSKSPPPENVAKLIPDETFGCDLCQSACPYN